MLYAMHTVHFADKVAGTGLKMDFQIYCPLTISSNEQLWLTQQTQAAH